jgi:hypothetical protein
MALTDRQKQIKKLLDAGKTPREVGEELGISENAVYQQRRRMKQAAADRRAANKSTTTKAASKPAPRKRNAPARKSAAPAASTAASKPEPTDPLSAVRHRRGQLESMVADQKAALDAANSEQQRAQKAHDEAVGKVKAELDRLTAVEALLTGKLAPPKPKRKAEAAPAPAQETPAPAPEPQAEAEAQPQAETAPEQAEAQVAQDAAEQGDNEPTEDGSQNGHTEERPGVPTLPEFSQEDAFATES